MTSKQTDTISTPPWLQQLNPQQREAVECLDGPLLVLSGAGTGKTRVLTHRVAHLLASGKAKPWEIMAVTFTNKAAREISDRVRALLAGLPSMADAGEKVRIGTFHRISAGVLRRHAKYVNLPSNFSVYDRSDQDRLLKQIMQQRNIDLQKYPPALGRTIIEKWKAHALSPEKVNQAEADKAGDGLWLEMYRLYQARLLELNACDFDDLLLHAISIFQQHPDVLEDYHARIRYVMVDEYQDSNVAQYLWLRLLVAKSQNLCCVGDEDQAIYSWRGAMVDNILNFSKHFPRAKLIRLEQNYRSSGHILAAASGLVAHNTQRLGKTLVTDSGLGAKPSLSAYWHAAHEAQSILARILSHNRQDGIPFGAMGVLVRAAHLMPEFEKAFFDSNTPYQVVGTKFFERREILDAMAYLRVVAQPADDLALQRIINTPRRGVGAAKLAQLDALRQQEKISMVDAAGRLLGDGKIKGEAGKTLQVLLTLITDCSKAATTSAPDMLLKRLLDESGYLKMWQDSKEFEAEGRVENLYALLKMIADYPSLAAFLEYAALLTDSDTADTEAGRVMLMTMHAAKGLEFDVVFLPGWEEGIFPSQQTIDETGEVGLEEERRLAYVGMTRARKHLHISSAASRLTYGEWQRPMPSRFIGELPADHIFRRDHIDNGKYGNGQYSPSAQVDGKSDGRDFKQGMRVFHDKFGNGNVLDVSGDQLNIAFDHAGEKTIKARFVTINRQSQQS